MVVRFEHGVLSFATSTAFSLILLRMGTLTKSECEREA